MEALAAGIAHEVRNPLNALLINVSILEEELARAVPDRTAAPWGVVQRIASELHRLDSFVSEFLRFARPAELRPEPLSLRALITDMAAFIGPECTREGIELRLALERGPGTVIADPLYLKHALLNVLLNAIQATPAGGHVTVQIGGEDDRAVVEVRDDGEGIPAHVLPRVFDVFVTTREGGTGLGLPIARRILQEHGGEVTIESRPGEGTTVRLALPVRPAGPVA